MQQQHTYNNKVDIWAYGCIAYELVVKQRAFQADWETMQYALAGGNPRLTLPFNPGGSVIITYVSLVVRAAINIKCSERPSVSAILQLLHCRWKKSVEVVSMKSKLGPSLLKHLTLRVQREIDWTCMEWRPYWYSHLIIIALTRSTTCEFDMVKSRVTPVERKPDCSTNHKDAVVWRFTDFRIVASSQTKVHYTGIPL
jgi:serine/threonine protein kinase